MVMASFGLISSVVVSVYLIFCLTKFLYKVWICPMYIQSVFRSQGIRGPPYKLFYGNNKEAFKMRRESMATTMELSPYSSHDTFVKIQPHIHSWIKTYGKTFLMWYGTRAQLIVTEPDLMKEILHNRDGTYSKKKNDGLIQKLFGEGLVMSRGQKWARHRKLASHAFHSKPLKEMIPAMITSVEAMLEKWKMIHEANKEIEVQSEFKLLTSEVISRTAFGSNYLEGKNIFDMLQSLVSLFSMDYSAARFPGIRTRAEMDSEKIEEEMHKSILKIINKREAKLKMGEVDGYGNDFLGSLIEAYHEGDENKRITLEDLIDECKTFYNAGHETATALLTWTGLLLATHADWQEKARNEVIVLLSEAQTAVAQNLPAYEDILPKLKIMNMIINETLRLYPPVVMIMRMVEKEVKLGSNNLIIPPNTEVIITPLAPHHDPEIWGNDVQLFKPERFSEGILTATQNKLGFVPFSAGPRNCVGMNFAVNQAKIALTMILQQYSLTVSPGYVHSPIHGLVSCPQHGLQLTLHPIE